mmetsp:Transcript_77966/g.215567  ORF Transcript_77966/g.215567 Transcript_77966/m.215567 type:complete len:257 (+) Transcript_77966:901-1671(+)
MVLCALRGWVQGGVLPAHVRDRAQEVAHSGRRAVLAKDRNLQLDGAHQVQLGPACGHGLRVGEELRQRRPAGLVGHVDEELAEALRTQGSLVLQRHGGSVDEPRHGRGRPHSVKVMLSHQVQPADVCEPSHELSVPHGLDVLAAKDAGVEVEDVIPEPHGCLRLRLLIERHGPLRDLAHELPAEDCWNARQLQLGGQALQGTVRDLPDHGLHLGHRTSAGLRVARYWPCLLSRGVRARKALVQGQAVLTQALRAGQ